MSRGASACTPSGGWGTITRGPVEAWAVKDGILEPSYPGRMARYGSLFLLDAYVTDPEGHDPAKESLLVVKRMLRGGERPAVCIQIRPGSSPPPEETRALVRQFLNEHGEKLTVVTVVLAGSGFWLAAFRAVITAVVGLSVSAVRGKVRVFATVPEAVAALEEAGAVTGEAERGRVRAFFDAAEPVSAASA